MSTPNDTWAALMLERERVHTLQMLNMAEAHAKRLDAHKRLGQMKLAEMKLAKPFDVVIRHPVTKLIIATQGRKGTIVYERDGGGNIVSLATSRRGRLHVARGADGRAIGQRRVA